MSTILLEISRQDLINSLNHPDFVLNMNPTEVWRKIQDPADRTVLLITKSNEPPAIVFERCLNTIFNQIRKRLTGDEAMQVVLNLSIETLKAGTIVVNGDVLVKVLDLNPDFIDKAV